MSMKISAEDLRTIAGQLDQLETVEGIEVKQFVTVAHTVHVKKDGGAYKMIGLTDRATGERLRD